MNEQIDMNLTKKMDIDSEKYVNIHIDIYTIYFNKYENCYKNIIHFSKKKRQIEVQKGMISIHFQYIFLLIFIFICCK